MGTLGLPESLARGPFSVSDARREGFEWESLQGPRFRRVRRAQYCASALPDTLGLRLAAALRTLPPGSGFCGMTAFAVMGLDVNGGNPIEASVPRQSGVAARAGLRLTRRTLDPGDLCLWTGIPVTTPLRTCFDLACRPGLVRSVILIEMALRAKLLELEELRRYVSERPGVKGVKRARRAVLLVRPGAESPPETHLRLIAVLAGLPEPEIQFEIRDDKGAFLARADLCYPEAKVVIEYDGAYHATSVTADDRRQNRLVMNGWVVLRFAEGDLQHPDRVIKLIAAALRERGMRIGRQIGR